MHLYSFWIWRKKNKQTKILGWDHQVCNLQKKSSNLFWLQTLCFNHHVRFQCQSKIALNYRVLWLWQTFCLPSLWTDRKDDLDYEAWATFSTMLPAPPQHWWPLLSQVNSNHLTFLKTKICRYVSLCFLFSMRARIY